MHKILIVDDETIFRRGLRTIISELSEDWEIVGEARDGYEALDMLEQLKPDVLLTDIRMPRMNGIQLQQIAREQFPDLQVIVISGYDDFTYVQQSLRQGASDYLMKPIEREELTSLLKRLKNELKNRIERTPLQSSHKENNEIRQHVIEHLIEGFLRGTVHRSELDLLRRIGVDFDLPYYTCLVIKLDKDSVDQDRYKRADPSLFQLYIQQFIQEILSQRVKAFSFVWSDTDVVTLINLPDEDTSMSNLVKMAESIRRQIKSFSNITVTIGVGSVVAGVESISKSYNEAEIALLYRLIVGGDKVLEYKHTAIDNHFKKDTKKWSWEALEHSINEGKTEETKQRLESVISDLCQHAKNPETVHQQICKLLIHYYELAEGIGIAKQWLETKDIRTVLSEVCSISSREELIEACQELLGRLTLCISGGDVHLETDPIEKSVRYLVRHFHEPVTLKDVADKVFLNPAYFSSLFKQRTGKTFVERLTEIRIEEAKRRLSYTDDKVIVIADKTGFANIRHFNRVFKRETNMSPKAFRDHVGSQKIKDI
jgi:two-component system response regulator YesN